LREKNRIVRKKLEMREINKIVRKKSRIVRYKLENVTKKLKL